MILFIWGTQVVSDQKRGMKNLATLSLLMFFIRNLPVPGGVSSASRLWLGGAAGGGVLLGLGLSRTLKNKLLFLFTYK